MDNKTRLVDIFQPLCPVYWDNTKCKHVFHPSIMRYQSSLHDLFSRTFLKSNGKTTEHRTIVLRPPYICRSEDQLAVNASNQGNGFNEITQMKWLLWIICPEVGHRFSWWRVIDGDGSLLASTFSVLDGGHQMFSQATSYILVNLSMNKTTGGGPCHTIKHLRLIEALYTVTNKYGA